MATAYRPKALEYEADSPRGLAWRMASYVKDPAYIRAMVMREHGRSPTVDAIENMMAAHKRTREAFSREQYTDSSHYNPENDNGDHWRPRGLVPPPPIPRKTIEPLPKVMQPGLEASKIIKSVAETFGIAPEEIPGRDRSAYVVSARFVACKLISEVVWRDGERRFCKSHIGRLLGGRDQRTISHMLDTFYDRARAHPVMIEAYEALKDA